MNKNEIVVCSKHSMLRKGTKFSESHTEELRTGLTIPRYMVDDFNSQSQNSGIIYKIDEEATEKWAEENNKLIEERKENENASKLVSDALGDLAKKAVAPKKKTPQKSSSK
ncbi:hypothetical protein DRO61_05735 [Candidatus Bathyarchaeota archaeon]|nr:MAG: hypothetical protein DRO61_05735 [Candidatus Bathyarchaeota archaeon]